MLLIPNGLKIFITRENQVGTTIAACDRLHGAWQQHQRQVSRQNFFFRLGQKFLPKNDFLPNFFLQYFSSALADSEHRLMLAEDAIGGNKTRARLGPPEIEPSYAHRSFR